MYCGRGWICFSLQVNLQQGLAEDDLLGALFEASLMGLRFGVGSQN